jgi:protein SCO1/2
MRVIVVLLALVASACHGRSPAQGMREQDPGFGADFTLTDENNRTFRLQNVRGRPAVLFFGYTSCPDMCPVTMSRIAGTLDRLGTAGREVATLFISVDPKRDTPAVLKEYVHSFTVPVIGLTGTEEQINRVAASYHAAFQLVPTGTTNYLLNHTSAIFLIDRRGRLRQFFKYDEQPDVLAQALRTLLDEQP